MNECIIILDNCSRALIQGGAAAVDIRIVIASFNSFFYEYLQMTTFPTAAITYIACIGRTAEASILTKV